MSETTTEETDEALEPPLYNCDRCDREVHQVRCADHGNRDLCHSCFTHVVNYCDSCDDGFDRALYPLLTITDPSGWHSDQDQCEPCHADNASWCDHCCGYHFDDCDPCYSGELSGLEDYSYKPEPIFHGDDRKHRHFGVEVEMESEEGRGQDALDYFRDTFRLTEFYYKGDGSLYSEDAIEMVSHPRTLDSWHEILPRLRDGMDHARRVGMRSWNTETCGIHIHIDSRAFGESSAHLYRFAQFIYRNEVAMTRLAGRGDVEYSHCFDTYARRHYLANQVKQRRRGMSAGDRYMWINLQNRSTVEVRMFRGSLVPERLLADIEFLHALLEYTRTMTTRQAFAGALKFDVFAHHALLQRDKYPHLAAMLADKFDMASA
jgi:hypothetical protein